MEDLRQGTFWEISNEQSLKFLTQHIKEMYESKGMVTVKLQGGKTRTRLQNNALHVYCRLLSEALNDAGYDLRRTLKDGVEVPWTAETVKEYLWKPIQQAITGNNSTATATREDYDKTHAVLSKNLSERFNIFVAFPKR